MNNVTLFNAMPDNREPDWSEYDALEVSPVAAHVGLLYPGETVCESLCSLDEPWDFHSVYARLIEGDVDLITDIPKGEDVEAVLADLKRVSGLEATSVLINHRDIPKEEL